MWLELILPAQTLYICQKGFITSDFKNVETEGLGDYSSFFFFFLILENGPREQKWYTYFLYLTH